VCCGKLFGGGVFDWGDIEADLYCCLAGTQDWNDKGCEAKCAEKYGPPVRDEDLPKKPKKEPKPNNDCK
jgi:hypothetical protein